MLREALTLERLRAMAPDEAAALLAVRRVEGLTDSEAAMLADWQAADPVHAAALDAVERSWAGVERVRDDDLIAAMRARALAPRASVWRHWPRVAAAAAVIVLALVVSLSLFPSLFPGQRGPELAWTSYESAPGQVRTVKLADGSVMTLDADSRAETRFLPDGRAVRLVRGRALFEVEPDAARPFAVTAASRRVVALGTRFEVDLGGGGLRVTLLKGKVAVEPVVAGPATVTLMPGQQFIEGGGATSVRAIALAPTADPGWRHGLIDLDDVPLSQAAAEVNRYSRERIVIRDPAVAALRVSGQFRTGDADRFARTVADLHAVRIERHGDEIVLGPAK